MSRGKRRKARQEEDGSSTIEDASAVSNSAAKRAWARLIKSVCEVDPLVYPRCAGPMRIIAFIEQAKVIEKILTHLGLCSALSLAKEPTPAHSAPVAGYPLPFFLQRVALAAQGVVTAWSRHWFATLPGAGVCPPVARVVPVRP